MTRVVAVLIALVFAGTAFAQDLRFVVVAHGKPPAPWWSVLANGINGAAEELGVSVSYEAPETFDMAAMSALIDEAVGSGADGIAITIPDADGLAGAIGRAVASGIPIVSFNSGSDAFERLGIPVHVGQPEYQAGLGAGQRMKSLGVSRAVCLNQEGGNIAGVQRCRGFSDAMDGAVDVLTLPHGMFAIEGRVANYFAQNPDVDGALILGPTASAPVIAVLTGSGRLADITLASFDFTREVLDNIRSGDMAFAVDQQPYLQGYLPVAILKKRAELGVEPIGLVATGPSFIDASNVEQVLELNKVGLR